MKRKAPERAPERSRRDPSQIGLLRIFLSLLLLLQALASFFPGPLFWGVNHLAYAPALLRIVWPLFGLLLIWTSAGVSFGRWLTDRVAPSLLGHRLAAYVAAPIVGALLFWLLRCKTHFLGDGWLLGEMVAVGIRFGSFNFIHYHLVAKLFSTLTQPVEADAFRLFAGTSIVAGALYLVAAAWSARGLSKDNGERILLYLLLVFFAPAEMFMGYVECYSILMVFMLLFASTIALHYLKRLPIWVPAAAFGLGLVFHLDALLMAPLLVTLVLWPAGHSPRSFWRRLALVLLPLVAAVALAAGLYLLEGYNHSNFETDFVKSRHTQRLLVTLLGSHGFLSWRHWKDILNLLLLVAPVPLLALLATVNSRKAVVAESEVTTSTRQSVDSGYRALITLLAGSLWLVFLMSLINMKLGIARDWDLFAAQTPIFVLASYVALSRVARGRPSFRLVGIVVIAAIFLSLPWFFLNASEARSVQRFKNIIADQPGFSQAYAHEELGKYYRKRGMMQPALEEYKTAAQLFPDNARFYGVLGGVQYNYGLRDDAMQSFRRALQADSTYATALRAMAHFYFERNETEEALTYSRKLAGSEKERADDAALHGAIAEKLGLYDEALKAYEKAIAKDARLTELKERIDVLKKMTRIAPGTHRAR